MKTLKQAKVKTEIETAVDNALIEFGIEFSVVGTGERNRDNWPCDGWRVTFKKGKVAESFEFFTGIGHRVIDTKHYAYERALRMKASAKQKELESLTKPFAPFAASVLHSLILDSSANDESFKNWCGNYGYDSDSMKAFKLYSACCDIAEKLHKVFNREQIAKLNELLEDY